MSQNTFRAHFPKVQLKPPEVLMDNYGNSAEDIVIHGKF